MFKRLILAAFPVLTALSLFAAAPASAQTVILVRHAEKADASTDPVLSEAGQERAMDLAVALGAAELTHVFVTPLNRTRLTATPAAEAHALNPEVIGFDGGASAHVQRIAERVRVLPADAVILIVGHSNTVPDIARVLGQIGPSEMRECEFDRLTVISIRPVGTSPTVISRYGAPSVCD